MGNKIRYSVFRFFCGECLGIVPNVKPITETRYILAPGTQVREEDFGLLFYTMGGPRLYFLSSGSLLDSSLFQGELTLEQWAKQQTDQGPVPKSQVLELRKTLNQLKEKGVILEC